MPRVLGILLSHRELDVAPAPRRVAPGETWTLTGVLPRGVTDPKALVLRVDGKLEEVPVTTVDRKFRLAVDAGDAAGEIQISLGAIGPTGHAPLLQVPIEVGRDLPSSLETRLPPDESNIRTDEEAEALAFELLNADRARFGLPQLKRDRALDAIAKAHSADMRDHGFFGHTSPSSGGPGDRLKAAGYGYTAYGENLAMESSLHGAEAGLLASLGHRRNLLSKHVTRVGVGVARRAENGRAAWHLTQLFARPEGEKR
jgi:uncharacterized protein YkwD